MPKTHKYLWNYANLHETFPDKKVDKNTFRLILRTFNNLLLNSLIEEGKIYKLPANLGFLGIYTFPSKNQFDYQHYKETGEKQLHHNLHADELVAQARHRVSGNPNPTSGIYRFRLARTPARKLAQLIKNKNYITKYFSYEAYFD
jgi:hypothetical protein